MEQLRKQIKEWVAEIHEESLANRRHLHAHPELSFQEIETTNYIASKMEEYGIPYTRNTAGQGLIGRLDPEVGSEAASRPVIALRSDIDAIANTEETGYDYSSQNPGVAHCCGHDIHMSILLGVAKVLADHRDALTCPVRFIFQPAEELAPGGARAMIEAGLLEDVDCYYGLHVEPGIDVGTIGVRPGPTMAAPTTFFITVKGRSGHGATPHLTVDPIVTASQLVLALQTIVSRSVNPFDTALLTIGHIQGGSTHNVIPDEVKMTGTVRTFSDDVLELVENRMKQICNSVCESMGATCELIIDRSYPVVVNQPEPTAHLEKAAQFMGYNTFAKDPAMIGEDFSFYLRHRTGCFFHLGTGSDKPGSREALHSSRHLPDDDAMAVGMEVMLAAVLLSE